MRFSTNRNTLRLASAATELLLELFDTSCRIDKTLFTRVSRVRVHGDIANNDIVFNAVDGFLLLGTQCRASQKLFATRNIDEANGIVLRVKVLFHGI